MSDTIKNPVEEQDIPALKKAQLVDFSTLGLPYLGQMETRDTIDIPGSRIGFGFETLDRFMFYPEKVYPHLAKLGAKWARVQSGWSRCEPNKGQYDFAWLEEIVDKLLAIGVEPFLSLTFGNILYTTDAPHESAVGFVPLYYGEEEKQAWANYVTALGETFKDRVLYWEVWNEPNIPQFWHPASPDGTAYAELVRVSAEALHRTHPGAKIVGGAISKIDPTFIEASLKAGMAEHIDAFSFHPYQLVPEDNLAMMRGVLRRLLDKHSGGKAIDIWQGENGCPSQTEGHNDDWLGLYNTDQVVQAKWVARRILADLKTGFDMALYFHAVDLMGKPYRQSDGKEKKPVMMGLIRGDTYEPKYSFEVLQRICTLFDDTSVQAELYYQFLEPDVVQPNQTAQLSSPMTITFIRNGAPLFAFWRTEDPQQKKPAQEIDLILWCDTDLSFNQPVLADLMTGQVYDIKAFGEPFIRDCGVIGTRYRLPLTDYPVVITDASVFPELKR